MGIDALWYVPQWHERKKIHIFSRYFCNDVDVGRIFSVSFTFTFNGTFFHTLIFFSQTAREKKSDRNKNNHNGASASPVRMHKVPDNICIAVNCGQNGLVVNGCARDSRSVYVCTLKNIDSQFRLIQKRWRPLVFTKRNAFTHEMHTMRYKRFDNRQSTHNTIGVASIRM